MGRLIMNYKCFGGIFSCSVILPGSLVWGFRWRKEFNILRVQTKWLLDKIMVFVMKSWSSGSPIRMLIEFSAVDGLLFYQSRVSHCTTWNIWWATQTWAIETKGKIIAMVSCLRYCVHPICVNNSEYHRLHCIALQPTCCLWFTSTLVGSAVKAVGSSSLPWEVLYLYNPGKHHTTWKDGHCCATALGWLLRYLSSLPSPPSGTIRGPCPRLISESAAGL